MRGKRNKNYVILSMSKASIGRWTLNHVLLSRPSSYNIEGTMLIEKPRIPSEDIDGMSKT